MPVLMKTTYINTLYVEEYIKKTNYTSLDNRRLNQYQLIQIRDVTGEKFDKKWQKVVNWVPNAKVPRESPSLLHSV